MCCLAKGGTRKFEERVQRILILVKKLLLALIIESKHVIDDKKEVPLEHQFSGIEKKILYLTITKQLQIIQQL